MFVVCLFTLAKLFGQQRGELVLLGELRYGHTFPVERFLLGENRLGEELTHYSAAGLNLARQSRGRWAWERRYKLPLMGVGLSFLRYDSPDEVGRPVAIYRYFRAPFFRKERYSLDYAAEVGLSVNWNGYDFRNNPNNDLMSTWATVYTRFALGLRYRLTDRFELTADAGLSHSSNGNVRRPNAGINNGDFAIGLTYRGVRASSSGPSPYGPASGGRVQAIGEAAVRPSLRSRDEINVSAFGGIERMLFFLDGLPEEDLYRVPVFPLGGLALGYSRRLNPKIRVGGGFSGFYRTAANPEVRYRDGRVRKEPHEWNWGNAQLSAHPSIELVFYRIAIGVQWEVFLLGWDPAGDEPRHYQKVSARYQINPHVFAAVVLNARYFNQAKFIEWHVGKTFGW